MQRFKSAGSAQASSVLMPPSTTPSTFNATSFPDPPCGFFEPRQRRSGKLRPLLHEVRVPRRAGRLPARYRDNAIVPGPASPLMVSEPRELALRQGHTGRTIVAHTSANGPSIRSARMAASAPSQIDHAAGGKIPGIRLRVPIAVPIWHICEQPIAHGHTNGGTMKPDLKNLLFELVAADYPRHRLASLARVEIETAWGDLSIAEIAELDAWLQAQQMATQGRDHVSWAYVRAALTSVQQIQGAYSNEVRRLP
jgi:hypothetical protein